MSRERLEAYIRDNRVDAKILVFDKLTRTAEDAEKLSFSSNVNAKKNNLVK